MVHKNIKISLLAMALASGCAFPAFAAGNNGWDRTLNGGWRYLENGEAITNVWRDSGNKKFYLGDNGEMVTNALIEDNGKYYGVDAYGCMMQNQWGQFESDDDNEPHWYWFQGNGRAKENGFLTVNGKKYHFTDSVMDDGWIVDGDNTYYMSEGKATDGAAVVGWRYINASDDGDVNVDEDGWYYFETSGKLVADKEKKIDGKYYAFNDDGLMCDYWVAFDDRNGKDTYYKYYRPGNGDRMDGWVYVEDTTADDGGRDAEEGWYYLKNGRPYASDYKTTKIAQDVGAAKVNGKYYAFDENGKMVTGKVTASNGAYYYFDDNTGAMKQGRLNLTEAEDLDEDTYYFNDTGSLSGDRGRSFTGVKKDYLYDNGVLVKAEDGTKYQVKTVDGKQYLVNEKGRIKKSGTVKDDDGVRYIVTKNADGGYTIWSEKEN